jgi:hypothetical protein
MNLRVYFYYFCTSYRQLVLEFYPTFEFPRLYFICLGYLIEECIHRQDFQNIQYFDGLLNPEFSINIQFEFYQYKSPALHSTPW